MRTFSRLHARFRCRKKNTNRHESTRIFTNRNIAVARIYSCRIRVDSCGLGADRARIFDRKSVFGSHLPAWRCHRSLRAARIKTRMVLRCRRTFVPLPTVQRKCLPAPQTDRADSLLRLHRMVRQIGLVGQRIRGAWWKRRRQVVATSYLLQVETDRPSAFARSPDGQQNEVHDYERRGTKLGHPRIFL